MEIPKASGVYVICFDNHHKFYIGSSKSLKVRWHAEKSQLKNNNHFNEHLQRACNIYGHDNLKFEIIELCSEEERFIKEQFWINFFQSHRSEIGFNKTNVCGTGRKGPFGEEHRRNFLIAHEKAQAKHYKFLNPDGEVVDIYNLAKFCRQNNLCRSGMRDVYTEKQIVYKGWRKFFEDGFIKERVAKDHKIICPDGTIKIVNNLNLFCKKHGLSACDLSHGWTSKGYRKVMIICKAKIQPHTTHNKLCVFYSGQKERRIVRFRLPPEMFGYEPTHYNSFRKL